MRNSLVYAGVAVLITLVLGMLIAAAMERRRERGALTEVLVTLPLGASAVSLGLGLLLLSSGMPGGALLAILLVPIAHSVVALPFFTRTVQPALASIPLELKESAAVLGASAGRIWREITLPILWRPILAGMLFAFTISLGEFGATSFLAQAGIPDPADRHIALPDRAGSAQLRAGDGHVHPADAGLRRVRVRDRFAGVTPPSVPPPRGENRWQSAASKTHLEKPFGDGNYQPFNQSTR